MRRTLWAPAALAMLAVIAAGCSGAPKSSGVASLDETTTAAASAGGSAAAGQTPLAEAVAYARCMRSHGVPNWPDPVRTPHGGYGFRTRGIDPQSAAFQGAQDACNALAPEGWSTGQQLSPAQQQAWLKWATCIRSHGVPNFPDPTFPGGGAVATSGAPSSSPQLQSAMDACKSHMPSAGGLGG
jgi:hypothetical protein